MTRVISRWVLGLMALAAPTAFVFVASPVSAQPAPGGTTIMNQNSCFLCAAASGPAVATNVAAPSAGPAAFSLFGPASTQQMGNNTVVVNQSSTAKSGDAVAGGQVTGVVGGGGPTTVMNSNNAVGAIGLSGPAHATNVAVPHAGPSSATLIGPANTSQFGNNSVIVNQDSDARSGDALAGSQVTGVVGDGGGGATVMNQNFSIGSLALSGPASATNFAVPTAGPSAFSLIGGASASQVGNNDAVLGQSAVAHTGDALAGSQSTGVVSGFGPNFVGGSNFALFPIGLSGPARANNFALGGPGPTAGPTLFGFANTSQTGNNTAALDQGIVSESGDGLAGSQVSGLVAQERGPLAVQRGRAPGFAAVP